MKLVSIIIPCYNYGWLLAETLDSVLEQTYPHWECIIVDDGSTDMTRVVAEAYVARDSRFRYLYQQNKGPSASRNLGIQSAQGEFLQFLDADDLLVPSKLEVQVAFLESHSEVDIVYGDVRYFYHGAPTVLSRSHNMNDQAWIVPLRGRGLPILELLVESNKLIISAPLLRIKLLKRVGHFSPKLQSMEDWEFWVRCAAAGAYFYYDETPNTWVLVRIHPTSLSQNMTRMLNYENKVRKELSKKLSSLEARNILDINKNAIVNISEPLAVYAMKHGKIWQGTKLFLSLGQHTGKYRYYTSSFLYWLRCYYSNTKSA